MRTKSLNIPALANRVHKIALEALESPSAYRDSQWYGYAGQWCAELDRDYSLPCGSVAGFVAALSPLNSWPSQVKFTPASLSNGLELIHAGESAIHGILGPGFSSNKDKAARILAGEKPLDVLGGDKVRAFFRNLTGDFSVVTIDRHALAICGLDEGITSKRYAQASKAFAMAGARLGITGAETQALTWVHWRKFYAPSSSPLSLP